MKDISKDVLPSELFQLFETVEYENYGFLKSEKIEFLSDAVKFDFSIEIREGLFDKAVTYRWRLKMNRCKSYHLEDSSQFEAFITVLSDHYLLSDYTKPSKELYFKDPGKDHEDLFIDIYNLHNKEFEHFILPEKYLAIKDLYKAVKSSHGLFARGPEDILDLYFNLLDKYKKNPYYLHYDKLKTEDYEDLKIVFLGNNYFIAEHLEFEKL